MLTGARLGGAGARGWTRVLRGLRQGDQRELSWGLALAALAYLRNTAPRKQLVFRKRVPQGSAVVVHNRRPGQPRIDVVKPRRAKSR